MKVLHVLHGYLPESAGGSESYVRDVTAEQRRRGIEPALVTGSMVQWAQCGVEELEIEGLRVLRVHRDDRYFDLHAKAWHPGVERIFGEILARERPDLVHVHQWIRLTSNLVEVADRAAIPAVVTIHDVYTTCPRCFRVRADDTACARPLSVESCLDCVPRYGHEPPEEIAEGIRLHHDQYRGELGLARAILVAARRTADTIAETTAFPRERLTVLPMAYRRRFPGGAPAAPDLPAGAEPFRFGYWGSLSRHKGVRVLLRAFGELVRRGPPRDAELHLLGPPETEEFERELRALADGLPVRFHGRFDAPELAAARLHMGVFPMFCFETFGFVLDECFELGLPCIVTDIGVLAERAGDAGLVVRGQDPGALAAAMQRVLERPQLRDELAARIRPLPPGPEEHVARLLEIYERALRAPRPDPLAPPIDPVRRAAFLNAQRESALFGRYGDRGPA